MDNANTANAKKKTDEIKQAFLSSAISDISAYIQLADTKVSIIMAAAAPKPVQITINILFNVFAICIVATALVPINEYDTV